MTGQAKESADIAAEGGDPLLQRLRAISDALDFVRHHVQEELERPLLEKTDLALFFLYVDLNEAGTLLRLIYKTARALRDVSARQLEHAASLPSGERRERRIEPTSEAGLLWQQRLELTPELTVLTKALYEWLFHIQEDIRSVPTLRDAISPRLLARLSRYCTFRSKLVTHKRGRKVHTEGGTRGYMSDPSRNEILLIPFGGLPEAAVERLAALHERAKPYLNATEASEENHFERMATLYRSLDRFPGELQGEVKTFMDHYGTISDTPLELAGFLDELTSAIMLSLRPATGSTTARTPE